MPDEAREVIFPSGVPVTLIPDSSVVMGQDTTATNTQTTPAATPSPGRPDGTPEVVVTPAEGGLSSDADTLAEQARQAKQPDEKEDLLRGGPQDMPAT